MRSRFLCHRSSSSVPRPASRGRTSPFLAGSSVGLTLPASPLASHASAHRHLHHKMGSVHAFRSELDNWVRSRGAGAFSVDSTPAIQLTNLPSDFDVLDFDISSDGHQIVLERAEAHSEIVLFDLHT
jgi:hypothetical protein